MPAPARSLTSADLAVGTTLPSTMHDGRIVGVISSKEEHPSVRFMLRTKIPVEGAYVLPGKQQVYDIVIDVLPEEEGPQAVRQALKDTQFLESVLGRNASVQLDGLSVYKLETAPDGKRRLYAQATGPRRMVVGGKERVLRKPLRSRRSSGWDFYTPSPGPHAVEPAPGSQSIRETTAELEQTGSISMVSSPPLSTSQRSGRSEPTAPSSRHRGRSAVSPEAHGVPSPSRPENQAQARAVPLAPNRSRSPRPLSSHALNFAPPRKRSAESDKEQSDKRTRLASPQSSSSALPPAPTSTRAAPSTAGSGAPAATSSARPHPHFPFIARAHQSAPRPSPATNTVRPQPAAAPAPSPRKRVDITSTPVAVPPPCDIPVRPLLPSPSTAYLSSRDTIETPFATQDSRDIIGSARDNIDSTRDVIDMTHSSQPRSSFEARRSILPTEIERCRVHSPVAQPAPPRSASTPADAPDIPPNREVFIGSSRVPWPGNSEKAGESRQREAETPARVSMERAPAERQERRESKHSSTAKEQAREPPTTSASPRASPVRPQSPRLRSAQSSVSSAMDLRRAAEERFRRENQARIAAKEKEEADRAAEASRLTEDYNVGRWKYRALRNLESGVQHLMGVIVTLNMIKQTKGPDASLTLIVADPSTHTEGDASDDRQITIFRTKAELEAFPFEVGRPVLFRNLKVSIWNERAKGTAFRSTGQEWYLWNGKNAVHGGTPMEGGISQSETERLKALERWWRSETSEGGASSNGHYAGGQSGSASPTKAPGAKNRTLGEAEHFMFFNATVKVLFVHVNSGLDSGRPKYEVYVSDGTVNPQPTRNFHQVDAHLHPNAIMTLNVWGDIRDHTKQLLKAGAILHFPNVRAKEFNGLELKWSDKMTQEQVDRGWQDRTITEISADDPRAIEIERRIEALKEAHKRGEEVAPAAPRPASPASAAPSRPAPPPPVHPISTKLMTTYTNASEYPRSTTAEIIANNTVPNRFRTLARVRRIIPRNAKGSEKGDLAVLWCKRCNNSFAGEHCQSCNDKQLQHADVQWQMLLDLEPEIEPGQDGEGMDLDGTSASQRRQERLERESIIAVLAGDEAARVLAPLPLVTKGPNEMRRLRRRISALTPAVEELLLGPRFDGERTRPLIDWSIESYAGGANGGFDRLLFRVFGMRKND